MYRSVKALKDTYITDRVIRGVRQENANVGEAGTLDLFKLYGLTRSGSTDLCELSRILVQFDLSSLRGQHQSGTIDISSPTFKCNLVLHDVYGGQTTPRGFNVEAHPLSRSWTEGRGRDVVFYQDSDVANFLTATYSQTGASTWFTSGANAMGVLGNSNIDVITSASFGAGTVSLVTTQSFVDGTEDLQLDVTTVVSATLAGLLPDYGFRLAFSQAQENDQRTRFVKRFGSRTAVDNAVRPELVVRFDDSRVDHRTSFYLNSSGTLFLNSYVRGAPANIVSGTALTPITGPNCMLLKLWTTVSGTTEFAQYVTASQHRIGSNNVTGVYSASFAINSAEPNLANLISAAATSGSAGRISLNEVWMSLDRTVAYSSSTFYLRMPDVVTYRTHPRRYDVSIPNVMTDFASNDVVKFRCFIYDRLNPLFTHVRVPLEEPTVTMEAHYSVRDVLTDKTVIAFDRAYGSTKMNADGMYLYFDVWMESLVPGRSYVIDVMLVDGGQTDVFYDASPAFRVISA